MNENISIIRDNVVVHLIISLYTWTGNYSRTSKILIIEQIE